MGAYGGALPSVEPGPAGGSGNALKILKPVSPDTWGGTYFTVAAIPFTAERKTLTARVYSTRANAVIKFKVEVPGGGNVEVASAPTGAANTWSTVSWTFSAAVVGQSYRTIAITPDDSVVTSGQAYWIDQITLAAAAPVVPPPTGDRHAAAVLRRSHPGLQRHGRLWWCAAEVETGPAGGSGNALKILKPVSPDTWGGTFFTWPGIPFTTERKVDHRARLFHPGRCRSSA